MPQFNIEDDYSRPFFGTEHGTEEFWEYMFRCQIEFQKLVNGYNVIHRVAGQERVDHTLTQHRRDMLRSIVVVDKRHTDKEGNPVLYWDVMLKYAHIAIQKFNQEDIQR